MIACQTQNKDAINVLLHSGANHHISGSKGDTLLHYAVNGDCNKEVLQTIIAHDVNVNATNMSNITALGRSFRKENIDAINLLLNAGADPNIDLFDGNTCLHYAVRRFWRKEVIQTIINHGANVNATNWNNITALSRACKKRNIEAINVLLNAGADPNIDDIDGNTCLQDAVSGGCSKEVLQTIINHGADINAKNMENGTAFMIACWRGHTDAINVLLNAGADPNIADADGNTCLHYAVKCCGKEVIQTIINCGANVTATSRNNITALSRACKKRNIEAINVLLNVGADPNIADADGNTCLHYAVKCCGKEVIQTIINCGANVNATSRNNITALSRACKKRNIEAINVLLNVGADLSIVDADGDTCLHDAVSGDCSKEVLQAIISHGGTCKCSKQVP